MMSSLVFTTNSKRPRYFLLYAKKDTIGGYRND